MMQQTISQPTNVAPERRIDLDWMRIGAFGLLILYHVGMFYVSWNWHIKSALSVTALEPLMLALNPWRLALLFLVSGVATRFMSRGRVVKSGGKELALELEEFGYAQFGDAA